MNIPATRKGRVFSERLARAAHSNRWLPEISPYTNAAMAGRVIRNAPISANFIFVSAREPDGLGLLVSAPKLCPARIAGKRRAHAALSGESLRRVAASP